jgi:hypothetical protein
MEQFKLEVARDGQAYTYDVHSLGNNRYDIFKADVRVGTLQLDDKNHQHCETIDCEIDLPLMNSIREGILLHEDVSY